MRSIFLTRHVLRLYYRIEVLDRGVREWGGVTFQGALKTLKIFLSDFFYVLVKENSRMERK